MMGKRKVDESRMFDRLLIIQTLNPLPSEQTLWILSVIVSISSSDPQRLPETKKIAHAGCSNGDLSLWITILFSSLLDISNDRS